MTVNPEILKWARETAGLTVEDAAGRLGINPAKGVDAQTRLIQFENGDTAPTRPMLLKMAKQYHRPIITFYLRKPPRKGDRGEDFRTLPEGISPRDKFLADTVVRDLRARQDLIKTTLEEENEARTISFIGSARIEEGVEKLAEDIAKTLEFDIGEYRNRPINQALQYLRETVESVGIFVLYVDNLGSHHTTIPVDLFRGFALADEVAPFIAVNVNDSKAAQAFTIIHELAHLWLGRTGISAGTTNSTVEKFCNEVAAKFLLPDGIEGLQVNIRTPFDEVMRRIGDFAHTHKVSHTMVALALRESGRLSPATFDRLYASFNKSPRLDKNNNESTGGGPSYFTIRRHRAGDALIKFTRQMLEEGAITTTKAAMLLGVNGKNVGDVLAVPGKNRMRA